MSYGDYIPLSNRQSNTSSRFQATKSLFPRTRILKYIIPIIIFLILYFFYTYELHVEISKYPRDWVHQEIEPIKPLYGCFTPERVSPDYNVSDALYGPRTNDVQAGMSLRFGLDCYDLAGTIKGPENPSTSPERIRGEDRIQFHTYWRADLASFGPRQEWMVKSFFATQNIHTSRLVLWSNGDLSGNPILSKYLGRYPEAFALRIVDIPRLARGTVLEGSHLLKSSDKKAWLDGDLIRLLLLWNYGGVWVDMDSLFTRDMQPLLEHEFVTQWDCYDKKYSPLNGALMRFRRHSAYLCEAFHIMLTDTPPRPGSTDWGSILYLKLYRRLLAASIPPFKILPFCFSDGRSCRLDNRLPDPFVPDDSKGKWTGGLGMEEGGALDTALGKVFGVHLHNQWHKEFPKGGWVERLLLNRYERRLRAREDGDE
ncbi:glycosyltransferase family 32 protein [Moniliophthora roreri]|uniref:Putative glycosyltransferase family 32 protein n=1 Tax=Moniliophthora roreri TaxID=221103 RepID=A0A0W0FT90_MONRR|nr:glycosyltransferase family 32 protein [Moniliophthora roreri]